MNKLRIYTCMIVFSCCSFKTNAALSLLAEKVLKELNLKAEDCHQELITEKQLPYAPGMSIMVIPKFASRNDVYFSLDNYVLLVDNKTGKIQSRYYESHATNGLESDELKLEQISIDTAPYLVKEGTKAFGIRVSFSGNSRANPYDYEMVSLYIQEAKRLKSILKNFIIKQYSGHWDTKCAGEFKVVNNTFVLSGTKTNGFYDMNVRTRIIHTKNVVSHGDCIEKKQVTAEQKTMKFSKDHYE